MMGKLRVAVLFGGQSGEHEVSLVSARAVIEGLDREKYEVVPIGISKAGRWLVGSDPLQVLEAAADPQRLPGGPRAPTGVARDAAIEVPSPATLLPVMPEPAPQGSLPPIDVLFPVLHGPRGEDGTVQGLFELADVPYVGCGVLASAVGMDKAMMKCSFADAELPQVPWLLVRRFDWQRGPDMVIEAIEATLPYPVFVKPANMGSSVGISKASDRFELEQAMDEAAQYDRRIVVEKGLDAREIEVSVLGNEDARASVPGEIIPSNEWYDYEAKYLGGESQILIPADLNEDQIALVRHMAVRAFRAIDGAGLARVDFLLERETGQFYVNEINTMPGFTPVSMYAKMWEASGLSYSALLDRLIELALERHRI
ncbi:MAG TPA: D-alanine--D-alanine ligase family protein [Roseiflexaceae bacterium]|nr:D-alanine--D-alanine ligase family protein [Roseiflexaceae bacterium]